MSEKTYDGIHDDVYGGMTHIGGIIKDAWVFGLLPETQDCAGWSHDRLQVIYDQVSVEWGKYGHLVGNLPSSLRERHDRIHGEAVRRAHELGWDTRLDHEDN